MPPLIGCREVGQIHTTYKNKMDRMQLSQHYSKSYKVLHTYIHLNLHTVVLATNGNSATTQIRKACHSIMRSINRKNRIKKNILTIKNCLVKRIKQNVRMCRTFNITQNAHPLQSLLRPSCRHASYRPPVPRGKGQEETFITPWHMRNVICNVVVVVVVVWYYITALYVVPLLLCDFLTLTCRTL